MLKTELKIRIEMLETEFKIDKKCKQTKNINKKSSQIFNKSEQFPIKSQTQQKSTKNHVNRSSLVFAFKNHSVQVVGNKPFLVGHFA